MNLDLVSGHASDDGGQIGPLIIGLALASRSDQHAREILLHQFIVNPGALLQNPVRHSRVHTARRFQVRASLLGRLLGDAADVFEPVLSPPTKSLAHLTGRRTEHLPERKRASSSESRLRRYLDHGTQTIGEAAQIGRFSSARRERPASVTPLFQSTTGHAERGCSEPRVLSRSRSGLDDAEHRHEQPTPEVHCGKVTGRHPKAPRLTCRQTAL